MDSLKAKKTVLYDAHVSAGGRIVEFAGWLMPVQFTSIMEEHDTVRNRVGLFDVSHMGEIDFRGPGALAAVQHLVCNDAASLIDGQVMYSGLMTDKGTFVDDVLVYKMAADHFMFCVNASNTDKDYAWIMSHLPGNVTCENISDRLCQIAVQGPDALRLLGPMVQSKLKDLRYYHFVNDVLLGHDIILSRTGYTGERGYEIYVSNEHGPEIWAALLENGAAFGVAPIGLGARDTLRLEAAMPLYGNDIDATTTPLEAGLDWMVKTEKGEFLGRAVLLGQQRQGVTRRLVGMEALDRGIPRHGYAITYNGAKVGEVTSGTHAPYLKKAIAMGYVPASLAEPGTELTIEIRGRGIRAQVVALPFYDKKTKGAKL
ncbi:glycine cleavage system aminomethyltransferase GcvT [bacterium]|nr:glycine cleavage system aminomethyltransferase GcvT [candidate division CSSED10-310 bacterium]